MSKKELPRGVPEEKTPIPGGLDKGDPPPFGTPRTLDEFGEVPRLINALDRSPDKGIFKRYKIWCANQETNYFLGKPGSDGEADVKALYMKIHKLKDATLGVKTMED